MAKFDKSLLDNSGFSTRAIHAGQVPDPTTGAVVMPVYNSSTFVQSSPGIYKGYDYSRADNPTRHALEDNLASLEGGSFGVCFASGCAATDAVIRLIKSGEHVVCLDDVYGGTYRLFEQVIRPTGVDFSFVDISKDGVLESNIKPNTKLIWIETPSNPLLKLIDIGAVAKIAKKNNLLLAVDNTFASPYLQNPLSLGADIVVHSSTKYLGGHSDIIGGAVVVNDSQLNEKLRFIQKSVGAVPSPMDCYMLMRSTKTLSVRMDRHSENAAKIAQYLSQHPSIEKLLYPGHPSHPQHSLTTKQMKSGGGMLSASLKGGMKGAQKFLESVKIFTLAESLGGVESLVNHPASMTHASIPADIRKQIGITDGLVRFSVGIEDVNDLLGDLEQALA